MAKKAVPKTIRVEHLTATLERIELQCRLIREVLSLQKPGKVLARKPVRSRLGEELEGGPYDIVIAPRPRIALNVCSQILDISEGKRGRGGRR